jgi:DnaJ-class molecular chaperone
MLFHPDKFSNDESKWEEAHIKFNQISEAYNLLKNYEPENSYVHVNRSSNSQNSKSNSKRADITRIRVKSSNVFSIGYDPVNKILQVEFRKGSVYEYYDVPEIVFHNFMNADSKGRFMSNLYKYQYQQV